MSERRVESDCNCNTIYATENYPQIFNKLGSKILKSLFCSGNHMNSRRVMYFDADFSKNSRTLATIKQQAAAGVIHMENYCFSMTWAFQISLDCHISLIQEKCVHFQIICLDCRSVDPVSFAAIQYSSMKYYWQKSII